MMTANVHARSAWCLETNLYASIRIPPRHRYALHDTPEGVSLRTPLCRLRPHPHRFSCIFGWRGIFFELNERWVFGRVSPKGETGRILSANSSVPRHSFYHKGDGEAQMFGCVCPAHPCAHIIPAVLGDIIKRRGWLPLNHLKYWKSPFRAFPITTIKIISFLLPKD